MLRTIRRRNALAVTRISTEVPRCTTDTLSLIHI